MAEYSKDCLKIKSQLVPIKPYWIVLLKLSEIYFLLLSYVLAEDLLVIARFSQKHKGHVGKGGLE
jgi:hypothetical protein